MNILINVGQVTSITLPDFADLGELFYATDEKTFYIGRGQSQTIEKLAKVQANDNTLTLLQDDGTGLKYDGKALSDWANITNKPSIPTKTSELTKDDIYTKTEINTVLGSAVLDTTAQDVKGAINEVLAAVITGLADLSAQLA